MSSAGRRNDHIWLVVFFYFRSYIRALNLVKSAIKQKLLRANITFLHGNWFGYLSLAVNSMFRYPSWRSGFTFLPRRFHVAQEDSLEFGSRTAIGVKNKVFASSSTSRLLKTKYVFKACFLLCWCLLISPPQSPSADLWYRLINVW